MDSNIRLERLIREARVQRSAYLGMMLGEFLANTWILATGLTQRAVAAIRPAQPARVEKTIAAR